ncbi:FeoB-associated Cys-rich membrane protein [Opitutus terrae]|uniref:FeoB-associated Cys-rich membrane protein n=1 Tax=Opitutus terrae (strain DSM 11246 / JCM 15787 / PB90-1) TaxID=452637 RepID=B1ZWN1_OPITP|nr:FeoB-associated Cys-rich membrane protein [Opitutus terrae]ACB74158.1 hypothetical protein Oter_0870 [Opitutus terrae PB90-1]
MTPQVQTILALLVVALAIGGLVWRAYNKRKNPGCGSDCGAVSPELKRLQKQLTRRR